MLHTHEVAGSSPAPPTSFDGEAPLRRLNPFPPRPLRGERVQGEGRTWLGMKLRPRGNWEAFWFPDVVKGAREATCDNSLSESVENDYERSISVPGTVPFEEA